MYHSLSFLSLGVAILAQVADSTPIPIILSSCVPPPPISNATSSNITVLPLGDSITFGLGSQDGNSYRQFLQARLAQELVNISYIGSVKSGNMSNNNNEGHSGAIINQISVFVDQTLSQKPQVVTLLAGTNDVASNRDLANAPARLGQLIDKVFTVSPNTTVLVSSIPPLVALNKQSAVDQYNLAAQALVQAKADVGQRVVWVDMTTVVGPTDLQDGVHPNAGGYIKMGQAWSQALITALQSGMVVG